MLIPTNSTQGGNPKVTKAQEDVPTMYDEKALGVSEEDLARYESLTNTVSALILGLPKVGKTRLLGTAPLPLLVYSFDPKSSIVLWQFFPELMKKRWIIVFPFWKEGGHKNPIAYKEWETLWERHLQSGFLDKFATVALDSYTGWLMAAGNYWLYYKNQERSRKERGKILDQLAQGDYPGLYDLSSSMIHQMNSGSWHFLSTCHLNVVRDEERGIDLRVELLVYKSLKAQVPRLFTENWILRKKPVGPGKVEYYLLTDAEGIYDIAGSQLRKDGLLKVKEKANIRYLFRKAGKSYEDKPHWKTDEPLPDEIKKKLEEM